MGCCCFFRPLPATPPPNPPALSNNRDPNSGNSSRMAPDKSIAGFSICSFLTKQPLGSGPGPCQFTVEYEFIGSAGIKTPFSELRPAVHKHTGIVVNVLIVPTEIIKELDLPSILETLQTIDHLSILRLFERYTEDDQTLLIVEEASSHRHSLCSELLKLSVPYSEAFVAKILEQTLSALSALNQKDLAYGLIGLGLGFEPEGHRVKLEDLLFMNLGLYEEVSFAPPESCGDPDSIGLPGTHSLIGFPGTYRLERADVWGCGVLLFLMVTGKLPFSGKDANEIRRNIVERTLDFEMLTRCSEGCRRVLGKMLEKDPEKRANAEKILEDAWFGEADEGFGLMIEKGGIRKWEIERKSGKIRNLFWLNVLMRKEEKNEVLRNFCRFFKGKMIDFNVFYEKNEEIRLEIEKNRGFILNFNDFFEICFKFWSPRLEEAFKRLDVSQKGSVLLEEIIGRTEGTLDNKAFWGVLIEKHWGLKLESEVDFGGFKEICLKIMK